MLAGGPSTATLTNGEGDSACLTWVESESHADLGHCAVMQPRSQVAFAPQARLHPLPQWSDIVNSKAESVARPLGMRRPYLMSTASANLTVKRTFCCSSSTSIQ